MLTLIAKQYKHYKRGLPYIFREARLEIITMSHILNNARYSVLRLPLIRKSHISTSCIRSKAATTVESPDSTFKNDSGKNAETLAEKKVSSSGAGDLFKADDYHLASLWPHANFTAEEMRAVPVAHRKPTVFADKVAWRMLQTIRWSFDFVTGYKHPPPDAAHEFDPKYNMSKDKWLQRFVFLESIAGVPGMVGGMVRHLHSLRLFKRDRAWIESLLEEAYNERMHLLSFIRLANPGIIMRTMVLLAQGIFFNTFFVSYLAAPRICHRFVGYLEEEAVITYTRCIEDMEKGKVPEFASTPAPELAIKYWKMPQDSTVKDLIYYVRADESKHREVNHTFGNLLQKTDPNPYALDYSRLPDSVSRPTLDLHRDRGHPVGWTREDIKL